MSLVCPIWNVKIVQWGTRHPIAATIALSSGQPPLLLMDIVMFYGMYYIYHTPLTYVYVKLNITLMVLNVRIELMVYGSALLSDLLLG